MSRHGVTDPTFPLPPPPRPLPYPPPRHPWRISSPAISNRKLASLCCFSRPDVVTTLATVTATTTTKPRETTARTNRRRRLGRSPASTPVRRHRYYPSTPSPFKALSLRRPCVSIASPKCRRRVASARPLPPLLRLTSFRGRR